eukprot:355665-Chlamydomonas_euryale.AAC.3
MGHELYNRAATPQPEAGPDVQLMDVPEHRNEPAAPEAAAAAPSRVAVEPQIAIAAGRQSAPAAAPLRAAGARCAPRQI